jgi:hypothetical protein
MNVHERRWLCVRSGGYRGTTRRATASIRLNPAGDEAVWANAAIRRQFLPARVTFASIARSSFPLAAVRSSTIQTSQLTREIKVVRKTARYVNHRVH